MILKSIYSEPEGLFPKVKFVNGINFVFGEKDAKNSKKSLNGIGKSLFLDLINFCLISNISPRLSKAKEQGLLDDFSAVLEFKAGGKDFIIKRSFKKSSEIIIVRGDESNRLSTSEAKEFLCDLIFYNSDYPGKYSNTWFRKLMPFFIKIQVTKKDVFSDPIRYILGKTNDAGLIPFHLFFMNIDNRLACKNYTLQEELKKRDPAIKQIVEIIGDTYGLKDIAEASNELDKTIRETKRIEGMIKDFRLAEQYRDSEKLVDGLTEKIKKIIYDNYCDNSKIKTYKESYKINIKFDIDQVSKIYSDINQLLGEKIKKTLDDAYNFKKSLAESRKMFLKNEIERLEELINDRVNELNKLEEERAKIFKFLEAKEAIKDLSEAYLSLNKRQEKISELSGKIGLHTTLIKEQAELKAEIAKNYRDIVDFVSEIKRKESEMREIFNEIYNSIYTEFKDKAKFSITPNDKKDQKIDINISLPADDSKGKNQGRTLIYDLAILINSLKQNRNMPRFLIHDGIFDGMDKAHFVHLYNYLHSLSKNDNFQYIITLNEEGTLNDKDFGKGAEQLTSKKISEEAILVLTPEKKLFGRDFNS